MKPLRFLWKSGLLLLLALTACNASSAQSTTPTPAPDSRIAQPQSLPGSLNANGILHPVRSLALSFDIDGDIKLLNVEVGTSVQAGQTLAVLDDTDLQRAVGQAALDVENAHMALAQLQAQALPVPERVLAATAAISSAQAALTQAQTQYDLRGNQAILDRAALTQAEQALRDAQNAYDNLLKDPTTKDWAPYSPAAKALEDMQEHHRLTLAQYRLHSADRGYEVAIANAKSQLAQAQLALYEAQRPVALETLALAELAVKRAEQALAIAQENLARATLIAPFDGIVAAVNLSVGEWVAPGAPVIELLDVSRWRVETKNVGELEIGRVQVGQTVTARINAFRDTPLSGRIVTISPVAVVQQGDTTYTLMIELDPTDLALRPGMTAQVEIETEQ
ncbi:MAG TPA: HlyD family efflux transporter periplasmic adaptor subunit [Anaerolineae bacterium]|mgnify:CR=1 FL=1|nr:HlyD family efflux transporter periplasmic adaptor subunit [Anaerolineae bacterium]HQI84745.1 HlyD family efflux transporter periplasmic adaptor subunit [Anaerolineae bacterium]